MSSLIRLPSWQAPFSLFSLSVSQEFFAERAQLVADDGVKDQLLADWLSAVNAPALGDTVQLPATLNGGGGARRQLVGVVVEPTQPDTGTAECSGQARRWRVRVRGEVAIRLEAGEDEAAFPEPEAPEAAGLAEPGEGQGEGEVVEVAEDELTLLTLRVSTEQRERWKELMEEQPGLFGRRMRPENEARWQRLFGGCAAQKGGPQAGGNEAELGLPLEQSFVATLYGVLAELLRLEEEGAEGCVAGGTHLTVHLLGCRPALELADPDAQLPALLAALPAARVQRLRLCMCGPEVGEEVALKTWEGPGSRRVELQASRLLLVSLL